MKLKKETNSIKLKEPSLLQDTKNSGPKATTCISNIEAINKYTSVHSKLHAGKKLFWYLLRKLYLHISYTEMHQLLICQVSDVQSHQNTNQISPLWSSKVKYTAAVTSSSLMTRNAAFAIHTSSLCSHKAWSLQCWSRRNFITLTVFPSTHSHPLACCWEPSRLKSNLNL